jgi:predicted TIM-barrel fold metal-dependent hydrolase
MIVDAHVHVFAKKTAEFPRTVSPQYPEDGEAPVESLLEQMENNGVDQAVLTQIGGPNLEHHSYLQHCLKMYPDRFRGIGLIPKELWPAPEDHMDRLAQEGRIVGFRLFEVGGPIDPLAKMDVTTFSTYPIWKHAADKDYVVWLYSCARDAHQIPFLCQAFPQVRVVFNHLMVCPGENAFAHDEKGRPRIQTPVPPLTRYSMLGLHEFENVAVKLSGQYAFSQEDWPYKDLERWHRSLLSKFGAERAMWASDFPWIIEHPGYDKLVNVIDELMPDLEPEQRDLVMGGAARKFLRFP